MSEEEQGDDPESIARWLAWYDALEPINLSEEDEWRIDRARAEQRAWEFAHADERLRNIVEAIEPE